MKTYITRRKYGESELQRNCVKWLRLHFPDIVCFAVPNGGARNKISAAILKGEGVLAGCTDLVILKPNKEYHALFVEMKYEKGRQTQSQKDFETKCVKNGYKYMICRSLSGFMDEVKKYLA